MSQHSRIEIGGLEISLPLYELVRDEMAPGTGVGPDAMWHSFGEIVNDLAARNAMLLAKRDALQAQIDAWHLAHRERPVNLAHYTAFLREIGYLVPEGESFKISTANVDPEIATVAGPQLVVPVGNPRYAVNAVNARWGSLFNALYATDVITADGSGSAPGAYDPERGARVIDYVCRFLDGAVGLASGSHAQVREYRLDSANGIKVLSARLADGAWTPLADPGKLVGFKERDGVLRAILLRNNGLHIELELDRDSRVGSQHPAGVKDVILEAAVTTIQDFEDSASAVDADDKLHLYRSWLRIMKGTLETTVKRGGETQQRSIRPDRTFRDRSGKPLRIPGRSLLLVRNVGLHMYTDAVTTSAGETVPEGFLDAMLTSLAALHDLRGASDIRNSRAGSVYIVKPKLHSPEEVAATVELFARVEDALSLARNTLKIGIMDEERRLTVNLKEAIRAASERVIFINTGFLDRTGDEIHTDMEAGPVVPKMEMKATPWIRAYEDWNVDIGIEAGLPGVAQIGKGMWAAPDAMCDMVEAKIEHPRSGANTAWVPSPRAAVLHAMHYHQVDVAERQRALAGRSRASLDDILTIPLLDGRNLGEAEVRRELENNAQGILGYVVRWIQQGIGCSKVPDIHDVALMEDRATLRISSQHIANWLHHGIATEAQVRETFERMAPVVDRQNARDPHYRDMAPDFDASIAFQAALDLVLGGRTQANGYTEAVLHARRREEKSALALAPGSQERQKTGGGEPG